MADDDLYDKRRGQRMLLTKWVKIYNSTDDEAEKERAAHNQINESTPDRPVLHLVLATSNPGALERALHGALVLHNRAVEGGGKEWYRTTVAEVVTIYHSLLGEPSAG